jgi:serine/threonine protein kinase
VLLRAMNDQGVVDGAKLSEYTASVAYDLWSFGVVLFHLCFGRPLWLTDINDNVTPEVLGTLASMPDAPPLFRALDKALNKGEKRTASIDLTAAAALLRKLLQPDPSKRLGYFELTDRPMVAVLEEPFFQGQGLDAASLDAIYEQNREILAVQDKQMALLLENKFELLHTRKVSPSSHPPHI